MNDEALRRWYQAREPRTDPAGHPSAEELAAMITHKGPEPARLATLDHVMACPTCRSDFELLRSILAADDGGRRVMPRWLPLAAALVLTVAAAAVWRLTRNRGDGVVRDVPINQGVILQSPADSTAVGRPGTFVWRSALGATGYRFELVAATGRLAYGVDLSDTAVTIPDWITVQPGQYRWWVTATTPDGESTSPLRTIVIR